MERAIANEDVEDFTLADVVTEVQIEAFISDPVGAIIDVDLEIIWETNKPNGQPRRCVDNEKAKNQIQFEPKISMDEGLKSRFFITHFFNPPRYMKLVELIYPDSVDKDALSTIEKILEDDLGKGVVHAKDTPNFIANRIGVFGMM